MSKNVVVQALLTRRSVRQFQEKQVSDEELKTVLEAGTYAPSSMGRQSAWIVAVQDKALISQLTKMNAAVMGTTNDPYYGAPTIVLVFGPDLTQWPNAQLDGALVLGNMMNAAHAIGLGSCWIHREQQMFATEEGKLLMKRFGLPDGLIGICALALGYPAGDSPAPKARKADYYRVIR